MSDGVAPATIGDECACVCGERGSREEIEHHLAVEAHLAAALLPVPLNPDADDPGWVRVGRYDSAERRALWIYDPDPDAWTLLPDHMTSTVVMRAGREGADAYVELRRRDFSSDEKWLDFTNVIARALYAARDTKDGGAP